MLTNSLKYIYMYIYNHINILLCIKKLVEDNNNFIYRKNKNQIYKIILHFNKLLLDKHFYFNNKIIFLKNWRESIKLTQT